ncbi:ribonuclease H-like domain-containing protein [Halodesulfovibrio aestuarii]|uniref:Ribonuclease H-like domain-containing protein n=1 Tax=Halodesulfovibrio aestuarii TaxID=126333 RepID=A0ABV4JQ09_9BACT
MITHTFLHIKGISKRQEQSLWEQGITDWALYENVAPKSRVPALQNSFHALRTGNVDFFARSLPGTELYRIALGFPDDVMFLCAETTGTSLYYDSLTMVGWSFGSSYGVYVEGDDPAPFVEAVQRAKVLVTFNGTQHDCKFIQKHFPELVLPVVHIDLRYSAKRAGFSGGRSAIEQAAGLVRLTTSETASVLWHRYRRGNNSALRRMITYNHADVEAQKVLLDACIRRMYAKASIPDAVQSSVRFADSLSVIRWAKTKDALPRSGITVSAYKSEQASAVTYGTLQAERPLDDVCVVGIDLVASEKRESGFCILHGNAAITSRVKTDEEMIAVALSAGADVVSIDSPLGIPHGRTSFWDDDPMREQCGITRECERQLKQRGVSSYPCLIPSMQKLTQRGMGLAEKFRAHGLEVIEGYPGGTQDILSIPRKQAGLQDLIEGLKEFGITGRFIQDAARQTEEMQAKNNSTVSRPKKIRAKESWANYAGNRTSEDRLTSPQELEARQNFLHHYRLQQSKRAKITHDELDAITSAIVGLFYLCGRYEALGNAEEGFLIVPDVR